MSGRGARRQVLDGLAAPLERLRWLRARWTVRSWVYDDRHGTGGPLRRARRADEYPENTAVDWQDLRRQAYAAAEELVAVGDYAGAQLDALTARALPS